MVPLIAAAAVFAVGAGCDSGAIDVPPPPEAPLAVRTIQPRRGPMREVISYVGTLRSGREVTVAARLAGSVEELLAEGSPVSATQVLARLVSPELDSRRAQVEAELEKVRSEEGFLCERHRVDQRLLADGAIAAAEVDAGRRACEVARAAVTATRARLAEIDATLAKLEEPAPFPGRILRHLAEPGQHVMPGQPLVAFGDDRPEVRVRVTEIDAARLSPGLPAEVRVSATALRGKVLSVGASASGAGRMIEVVVQAPEGKLDARFHGSSAEVDFILAERDDAVSVPRRSVRRDEEGLTHLFVVEDERLRRVPITAGFESNGWVAVDGLEEGARVVLEGARGVGDGAAVYAVQVEQR